MTDDERLLLAAICTKPDDDVARLAYADLLEERGDDRGRAEFIRLQIEHARLVVPPVECGRAPDGRLVDRCQSCHWTGITCRYHEIEQRCDALQRVLLDGSDTYTAETDWDLPLMIGLRQAYGQCEWVWHRGFPHGLRVDFRTFGEALWKALWHPGLTDRCPEKCWPLYGVFVRYANPIDRGKSPYSVGMAAERCPTCGGKGRVPVTCPEYACPIRWVEFTSVPRSVTGQKCFDRLTSVEQVFTPELLRQNFPGVRFYVTSEVLDHDDTPSSWANPDALYDKQDGKNGIAVDAPESSA